MPSSSGCRISASRWQKAAVDKGIAKEFPLILSSGRLVDYEGGGEETRSNRWLAELQQDMFIEISVADAADRGIKDGGWVWVSGAESNSKAKMKALVTERVGKGVAWMPFHFGGWFQGDDMRKNYPAGSDPIVPRRKREHHHQLWLRSGPPACKSPKLPSVRSERLKSCRIFFGESFHASPENALRSKDHGTYEIPLRRRSLQSNATPASPPAKTNTRCRGASTGRRVVTLNDGKPGERSVSMACMHCTDAPCAAVCPVDAFYTTVDAVVLHSKDICIGCGYCFYACPFGAPQYPKVGNFGLAAAKWTSAPSAPVGRSRQ